MYIFARGKLHMQKEHQITRKDSSKGHTGNDKKQEEKETQNHTSFNAQNIPSKEVI